MTNAAGATTSLADLNFPAPLVEKIARLEPPAAIGVSGFGGAGKSGFAVRLGESIGAPVVGIDSFVTDWTLAGYTHWELMDFGRLEREVLRPFAGGQHIRYGQFNWAENRIGEHRELPPTSRLVIEGVGLFRPDLLQYFSLLIWVACPLDEAIRRGKKRDREEYGNPQDELWEGLWKKNDKECYRDYQPEKVAHFVFDNSGLAV